MTQDAGVIPAFERMQYEALFHPVTRLPGWALLLDRVDVALLRANRVNRQIAVVILSDIKDAAGRALSVVDVADELRSKLRTDDTVAQVGDRTFVVVCNEIGDDDEARVIAQRLMEDLGVVCTLSIALSGGHRDRETVLTCALEQAMH